MKLFTYGTDATACFEQLEKECEENFGDLDFKVVKKGEQYYISLRNPRGGSSVGCALGKEQSSLPSVIAANLPNDDVNEITYIKIKVVRNGGGGMFGTPWFNMSLRVENIHSAE